jgi:uncharacterized protein (TIGR03435 family)
MAITAQAPVPEQFEVASIKPNSSDDTRRMLGPAPGGRFLAVNVTLRQLVAFAFGVSNSRSEMLVLGGPAWVGSARFDVDAVASGGALPPGTAGPLVRKLLEQRFALRAHRETTERPVYHLVVDRTDGRLGPNLRPTSTNCEARRVARASGAPLPPITPVRPPADPSIARPQCGVRVAPGHIAGDGVNAADIAEPLAPFAGRLIIDRTGLRQYFDVDLEWATEGAAAGGARNDLPPLVTALREQLGLRLEDARGPVEVVAIDVVSALVPN